MPSLLFPDTGTRMVVLRSGKPAKGATGYLYSDAELTVPAEVYYDVAGTKGSAIPLDAQGRRAVTLNAYGEQVDFWGPASGQDRLWIVVNGVASKVDADYNARLDSAEARIAAVEEGGINDALLLHKGGAEEISGTKTFTTPPKLPAPVVDADGTPKQYVDDQIAAAVETHTTATDPHGDRAAAATALIGHTSATTSVHGITDTANLVLTDDERLSDDRTPTAHAATHAAAGSDPLTVGQSQVTGLVGALAGKADLVGGLVPTSQIPASSATYLGEVASEAAMLALPAAKGDYARRTDTDPDTFWTLIDTDPTLIGSWLQTSSAGAVSSVNSQSGNVVLGPADVGAASASRVIATTAPLTGGGTLSADRTLAVSGATTGAVGVVQLAGDLAGTATAPVIAAGAVTAAKIAPGVVNPELVVAGAGIDATGVSDSTTAIQALLTAAGLNSITAFGQTVRFPAGRFKVSATLLSDLARGVRIVGAGRSATYLIATSALAGLPVIKMQDYYHCSIADMTIQGTSGSQPSAAIESHREQNNGVIGAQVNQRLHVTNVEMVTVQRAIHWTYSNPSADGNNDQATVTNCYVHAFTVAAYDINGVNPVWIRFVGGEIAGGPIAWRMSQGGSFNAVGTVLGALTDVEIDVLDGAYIHATSLIGVSSEHDATGAKILRTTAGVSNFAISYEAYERTQSVVNKTMIDFQATGRSSFQMTNCYMDLGQLGQVATFTDSTSTARFIGCQRLAFNTISYNGALVLNYNKHHPGTVTLTNLGSGQLFQWGDQGGGFTPQVAVPSSRTISTTAPLTGGGDLSANRTLAVSAATTGATGVIQLAGDLAGTATAPTIAPGAVTSAKILDGTIVDADINASAGIAQSKISGLSTSLGAKVAKGELVISITDAPYNADPTGVTDSTAAIQAAVDAAMTTGNPVSTTRTGLKSVYIPKGKYKITAPIRVLSVMSFRMFGEGIGSILAVSGNLTYGLELNGVAFSEFENFEIQGNTSTDTVVTGVALDWDPAVAARSTTANNFRHMWVRGVKYTNGFAFGMNSGVRQVDQLTVEKCGTTGSPTPWTGDDTSFFQNGFVSGSGTHGNPLNHNYIGCMANGNRYNVFANACNVYWWGGHLGYAEADFKHYGYTPLTVEAFRSETSKRLLFQPTGSSLLSMVSIRDVRFVASGMHADGRFISMAHPGDLQIDNLVVSEGGSNPSVYYTSSSSRPLNITARGLRSRSTIDAFFVSAGPTSPLNVMVDAYTQYDASAVPVATTGQWSRGPSNAIVKEAPLNPLRFGAVGDGATNDDAAFADMWSKLPTVGGHIYLPTNYNFLLTLSLPLHTALRIEGADRRRSLITNKVSSVFTGTVSMSDLHLHDFGVVAGLTGTSSGGHILDFTGSTAGPFCSSFHNLYLQQNRADRSVLYVPDGQYLDNQFRECQTYGYNRSVPAFYLRSTTGSLGDNLFADIRHTDDGVPTTWALWLEEFSTTTALGNTIERINFENPAGGAICLRGQNGADVRQIWLWDMATTSTNHLILLEKIVSGQPNTGVTLEKIARPSGTLGPGLNDIYGAVGHHLGTTVRRCVTDGSQALRIDLAYSPGQVIENCYGSGVSLQSYIFATTIGAGAGTGATVNAKTGGYYDGNITINSGTSPSAGVIVSVSWPNGLRTTPSGVTLTPMTTSAYDACLYVTNLTNTGFDVATKSAVTASTAGIRFAFATHRSTAG